MQTALPIVSFLLDVCLVGVGLYLASYLKRKAQTLATREEFKDLQRQTAELTRTTKEIEATISGELWNQQKRWELKREVLFQATQRISAVFDALKDLENLLQAEHSRPDASLNEAFNAKRVNDNEIWFKASAALRESRFFVEATCSQEVIELLNKYAALTSQIAASIFNKDGQIFRSSRSQLFKLQAALVAAFRKELGYPESGA